MTLVNHIIITHMRTMVLEYAHQHLPLSKITYSFVGKYSSTMVRIWVMYYQ